MIDVYIFFSFLTGGMLPKLMFQKSRHFIIESPILETEQFLSIHNPIQFIHLETKKKKKKSQHTDKLPFIYVNGRFKLTILPNN